MPKGKRERVWGVLFTDAGLNELGDALAPYLSKGSIGSYLYCKKVEMTQPFFHMVADYQNPDGPDFEAEIYVPYHYIKCVVAGTDKKKIGFELSPPHPS